MNVIVAHVRRAGSAAAEAIHAPGVARGPVVASADRHVEGAEHRHRQEDIVQELGVHLQEGGTLDRDHDHFQLAGKLILIFNIN